MLHQEENELIPRCQTKLKFCSISDSYKQIPCYHNYDLDNVVTPVNADKFCKLLKETNYDPVESNFLIDGFKHGFDIGYHGPMNIQQNSPNLKFRGVGNHEILWGKVMKEVRLRHFTGPFTQVPYDNYMQSPIGLGLKMIQTLD